MNQVDSQTLISSMRNMVWSFIDAAKYHVYKLQSLRWF